MAGENKEEDRRRRIAVIPKSADDYVGRPNYLLFYHVCLVNKDFQLLHIHLKSYKNISRNRNGPQLTRFAASCFAFFACVNIQYIG